MIRLLFLEGKSRSEIIERMDAVYDDSASLMVMVKNLFNEFSRGCTFDFHELRLGVCKTSTTENNMTKVQGLVLTDL